MSISRPRLVIIGVVLLVVVLGITILALPTALTLFAETDVADHQPAEFTEVAHERGFVYEYVEDEAFGNKISLTTDAGLYVVDYNQNGWEDILAIGGAEPILFENRGGTFAESSALPGIGTSANGALFFDHDNDGYEDLLLLPPDAQPIFLENQGGEFVEQDIGFDVKLTNPTGATAGDFTGNGCLDIFIIQNGDWDDATPVGTGERGVGEEDNGNPNYLVFGDCENFELVDSPTVTQNRWTLAVTAADLTGNGHTDIYEANDFNADILYENQGDGTFERQRIVNSDRNAMSATLGDVTGDHRLEVFVTNIFFDEHIIGELPIAEASADRARGNNLFVNLGESPVDQAVRLNVREGGWGWAAIIEDLNNDGNRSIVHTTSPIGVDRALQERLQWDQERLYYNYPYLKYPMIFDRATETRFRSAHPPERGFEESDGRGLVAIDSDGDGTIDLAMATVKSPYKLYDNHGEGGNWIRVEVTGDQNHTQIGAEIVVTAGNESWYGVKHSQSDFLSQESRILHFGIDDADRIDLQVTWPDGTERTFEDVSANQQVIVSPSGELVTRDRG